MLDDEQKPSLNLVRLLPVLLVALTAVGNAAFCMMTVAPQWQVYERLTSDGSAAATTIANQPPPDDSSVTLLQAQLESASENLNTAAGTLLSEAEVDGLLDRLYAYADQVGVAIVSLQAQPDASADGDEAAERPYQARVLRVRAEGSVPALMGFIARFQEARSPSVALTNLAIQPGETDRTSTTPMTTLVMDVVMYTSPISPGGSLTNLPTLVFPTPAPPLPTRTPAFVPTATPAAATEQPTATLAAVPIPTEPVLNLLSSDNFDAGAPFIWSLGPGWTVVSSEDGQALEVENSGEAVTFLYNGLLDAAVQARFWLESGSVRLSLRHSSAGSYTVIMDAVGQIALYRNGTLLQSAVTLPAVRGQWHTLRLAAIQGVIRVSVDGVEAIALLDPSPLPPGTVSFALVGAGRLRVDDIALWTLDSVDAPTGP